MDNKNKLNKTQILRALKADLKSAETMRKDWDGKIDQWRREYNGEPYGNEKNGKSKVVSRDIKKQDEWLHPSLLDPFVSTRDVVKVMPVTWEDEESARQSQALLNYQFCRQFERYNFMSKALKVLSQEGTLVVQTGWDYEDEEVESEQAVIAIDMLGQEYIAGYESVIETVVKKNQPTARVCRNEDVYIDPTCMDDMDKCQFVIHRYETDLSTLRQDGRYKNLTKVAKISAGGDDYDYDPEDETEFRFEDEARKKRVVYEYWGNYDVNNDGIAEPIVCAWIDDVIIRLESNPYPDKKPPFLVVPFNSVPFQMYGESDAELVSDNQKIKTAITRGIIDNMAQSNNGQVGVRKGSLDAVNKKRWEQGRNFEFAGNPGTDIWSGSFNSIPNSAFNMLELQNNEIESLTAVKSFSGGITGAALGSTATGARGALDATATRKLNRVRNISENLIKPLMRKWLAYSMEFLEDEEIIRVTNEDYVTVRRDDLDGRIDLDIEVSTSEDNQVKSQELSFLLQTLGQGMDVSMRNMIMAEIARLHKMPALEKQIREYQPQPDPMAEQMQQLQMQKMLLENQNLQAEIEDKLARAGENLQDIEYKRAKTAQEQAKARTLNSKADLDDLKFLREDEQVVHKEKLELEEFKRLKDLDMLAFQKMYGSPNEQIGVPR